jgi:hypothetical protein
MSDFIINYNSPNVCNSKLNLTYDSINNSENTYLQTIFYKTIPFLDNESVSYTAEYNYNNYDIFCLNCNLSGMFCKLGFNFEYLSMQISDKMYLCIILKNTDGIVIMSPTLRATLQSEVDFVCKNLYHMCLLFDPSENYNLQYPKEWIYNIFCNIQISEKYKPSFVNNKLYLSLDERLDYKELYSNAFDELLNLFIEYYSNGVICTTPQFATDFNLTHYFNDLYISNWKNTQITNDISNFLLQLSYSKNIHLNIIPDSFNKHYIAKKYTTAIFDYSTVLLYIPDYNYLIQFTDYINDFYNLTHTYSLYTFKVQSNLKVYKYYEYLNLEYPEIELVSYNCNDSLYPYTLSLCVYTDNYDFSKVIQSLKNL